MAYVCTNCGICYAKWQGKCDSCKSWNTLNLLPCPSKAPVLFNHTIKSDQLLNYPKKLEDIPLTTHKRLVCQDEEFNRVLGGGIVPGSLILLGGEPGIGKSTLLLQIALNLTHTKVLYVSGEETETQIKARASRINLTAPNCFFLQDTSLIQILHHANNLQPKLLIIDSIQTIYYKEEEGPAGNIHQIKACATQLLYYAKHSQVAILIIGHINKEGTLAGPKLLEHMVDTVLQFEGDKPLVYRMIRTLKNRFGATLELGIYEMKVNGLNPIKNPSARLLSQQDNRFSGMAIGSSLEGTRPLILEVQALVTASRYGHPQRNTTGYDFKRLLMLLAVLEKRVGLQISNYDIFLNITGGLKTEDTALDLAICMAITSSLKDIIISNLTCFIAEIGLLGELRAVPKIETRIKEAQQLGFKKIYIAPQNIERSLHSSITIHAIPSLKELIAIYK